MFDRKLTVLLLAFVFAITPIYGQDAPSLGDVARRLRAEKDKPAAPAPTPSNATSAEGSTAAAPSAKTPNPVIAGTQTAASGQFAPYATRQEFNLYTLDRYEEGIRTLFQEEKFEILDQTAATARSTKARLIGGFWTLHILYFPLTQPSPGTYETSESEWTKHLERLQRWVAQRPDSITARVALGAAQLQYAWRARGGGYADSVTDEGWKLFHERAEVAAKTLMDASSLQAKCPEWYLAMQLTARALGQSKEMQTAIFEKAIAFEPDYQYFYRTQAEMLMPKWEGEDGEMASFAQQIADRIGGKRGDMIYYQIATYLNCGCDNDRGLNGLSWSRIKRGYSDIEEQYGEFVGNLNAMGYMAGMAGDMAYANDMFKRIGEAWDKSLWHKKENFQMVRQWAQFAELPTFASALKAAGDNLQTAAGRKFDEDVARTFASNYSSTVAECLKMSGDTSLTPFDMVLQVGQNGAVEQIFVSRMSRMSSCMAAKVGTGVFPVPPKPGYWIKISLQAQR